jgi:predicted RNase H-like HicB family nuclease
MPKIYPVTLWKEEGMWTAHAPSIPGLYGLGKTPAAAKRDLAAGMRDLFAYLDEIGEPRPRPIPVHADRVAVAR